MYDFVEEFEAICKDGKRHLIQVFRAHVPFQTLVGDVRQVETLIYKTIRDEAVKKLRNGDFMIESCGTVLRRLLKVGPP